MFNMFRPFEQTYRTFRSNVILKIQFAKITRILDPVEVEMMDLDHFSVEFPRIFIQYDKSRTINRLFRL